jgi:16S rRNA (cytidine1402-2'-O)-methyltransferase
MSDNDGDRRCFALAGIRVPVERPAVGLHLVATPIGNLADITLRALSVLAGSDTILCEDTRVTSRLLQRYGIRTPMGIYHDHNAAKARPRILAQLADGARLALVSDAGTPLVSDPGYKLVREAIAAGVPVHMAPGPSAPLLALALSGLPSDRFLFAGFVPPTQGRRMHFLAELAAVPATLLLFETAPRLQHTLAALAAIMGDRDIAIARELTKLHEEVLRGSVGELVAVLSERPPLRGEVTLVIAPPAQVVSGSAEEIDAALREALANLPVGRAAAEVARRFRLPRNELYRRAVELRGAGQGNAGDASD